MIASVLIDPILLNIVLMVFGIISTGLLLKWLNQPAIIAYIIAGIVMGPHGLEIATDLDLITNLGSFGLILLLFFVGMEISLPQLLTSWKLSVLATLFQVFFSIGAVSCIGYYMNWPLNRIIMMGFVISLSSTAVVIKLLQDSNETDSLIGKRVIGVLLVQDILIVPMLIILSYLSGSNVKSSDLIFQIVGGIILIGLVAWVAKKKELKFPFDKHIKRDHELQVFVAFAICFGFALASAFFGLSSALGAFVAGILVSSARATEWVHHSLNPFRVVFVALFFVSIGMLIDLAFLSQHLVTISVFVVLTLLANTMINAIVFHVLGETKANSIYIGAILAQIGEFSFVLGTTGYFAGIITEFAYQLIISIISLTLVISPFWIALIKKVFSNKLTTT